MCRGQEERPRTATGWLRQHLDARSIPELSWKASCLDSFRPLNMFRALTGPSFSNQRDRRQSLVGSKSPDPVADEEVAGCESTDRHRAILAGCQAEVPSVTGPQEVEAEPDGKIKSHQPDDEESRAACTPIQKQERRNHNADQVQKLIPAEVVKPHPGEGRHARQVGDRPASWYTPTM